MEAIIDCAVDERISGDKLVEAFRSLRFSEQEGLTAILGATGMQAEEIGDEMCIAPNTVRKHLNNGKDKSGLRKMPEITGFVICAALGVSYESVVAQLKEIARSELKNRALTVVAIALVAISTSDRRPVRSRAMMGNRNQYRVGRVIHNRRDIYL